jgi:F1F0 ATPase subunit 2
MAMSELLSLALSLAAGVLLGAVFFGGLWWTVRKGVSSKQPALWIFCSLLLRMGITLAGFYFVSGGHWERLLLCLLGFVMARIVVTWLTQPSAANAARPAQEVGYAP